MLLNIAVAAGDGIGPEVTDEAVRVLNAVSKRFGHTLTITALPVGGAAYELCSAPLPQETLDACMNADAVLLGAVGGPKWSALPYSLAPERALLGLRSALNLFCNLRPVRLYGSMREACPLKSPGNVDIMIVRELAGGIYFGDRGSDGSGAFDTEKYTAGEVLRIGRAAFDTARSRGQRLCSVDKANVLESSRLWRSVMHSLRSEYPDVGYSDMLVDTAAMTLVRDPASFGVIVTSNMFGDILSDEAAAVAGSMGLLPSASTGSALNRHGFARGMYEPVHGSAPDIAGTGSANPVAAVLSAAMMLRYSFGLEAEAAAVERAAEASLEAGITTPDIGGAFTTPVVGAYIADAV